MIVDKLRQRALCLRPFESKELGFVCGRGPEVVGHYDGDSSPGRQRPRVIGGVVFEGVGKTTLTMQVLQSLKLSNPNLKVQGFYTSEMRQGSERVGFQVVTLDGRKSPLASSTVSSPESVRWPNVGKYKVDVASFESLALPELQVRQDTDLFIIDEVGKMELFSSSFFPAVSRVLEANVPVLATIPIPKFGRDIPEVARLRNHPQAILFTLSKNNRDAVKEQIFSQLLNLLPKLQT